MTARKPYTVADLKRIIATLPDDTPIIGACSSSSKDNQEITIVDLGQADHDGQDVLRIEFDLEHGDEQIDFYPAIVCPSCGEANPRYLLYCEGCGEDLPRPHD